MMNGRFLADIHLTYEDFAIESSNYLDFGRLTKG